MKKLFLVLLFSAYAYAEDCATEAQLDNANATTATKVALIVNRSEQQCGQCDEPEESATRKKCCCITCVNSSCSNFTVNGSLTVTGSANVKGGTLTLGSVKILQGSGAPTASAPQGSLYLRTDGSSTSTRAYINTDGSTTWTSITTAA